MRELPEKLVDNAGISKNDEEDLLITTVELKKLATERRGNE